MLHTHYFCQAELEYGILSDIQTMVKSGFIDGIPPHHQPSARLQEYDENGSSIFVSDWEDFRKLTAAEVQAIFRNRHILVRNGPVEKVDFTLDSLEMLGSVSRPVCLQGKSQFLMWICTHWWVPLVAELRGAKGEDDLIRAGTLQDLHIAGTQTGKRRIVNGLDFPLGYTSVVPPPRYRSVSIQYFYLDQD
jgi:hypothetical protein